MSPVKVKSLQAGLLDQLSSQVVHSPPPVIISMGLITFMASLQAPQLAWLWGGWFIAVVLMQGLRVVLLQRLPRKTSIDVNRRLNFAIAMTVGNTVVHSLSLFFFPLFTPYQAAVQSMLFIAMGVASIITTAGFLPFTLMHVTITLLPLFGLWAWSGIVGPGGAIALAVAFAGLGYSLSILFIAKHIFIMYRETFETRQQLQVALADAESASSAKTRFLASASHDLRQPIHTLSLFSAALSMRKLDKRTRHIAENIDTALQALTGQLDALLDISKLDAGIISVRKTTFNLHSVLLRLEEEFQPAAQERGMELELDCPDHAFVKTDAALLERVITNLLANAINHNHHCTVRLSASSRASECHLVVSDNGAGIALEEQSKVFEEFYQLENPERDRSKGLGLGLAIVRRMSELLELDMRFESAPGRGTSFTFTLPPGVRAPQAQTVSKRSEAPLESLSVLVVDDESAVREGMKVLLEMFGCNVSITDSTESALSSARLDKPDLALVDLRLRGDDNGFITIHRLRQLYPGLKAIIISGDTAPDRLQQARAAGIRVLSKPVLGEPLRQAISEACHLQEQCHDTGTNSVAIGRD